MIVELQGVNFVNKGAELMMAAVLQRLAGWTPPVTPAAGLRTGGFFALRKMGIKNVLYYESLKGAWVQQMLDVGGAVTGPVLEPLGIYKQEKIGAILDASGFAYSDQWGPNYCQLMATKYARAKKAGAKVVLLPQAFGPFEGPKSRAGFQKVYAHCDLIFARDPKSLELVQQCVGAEKVDARLRLAPDFTNLVKGTAPASMPAGTQLACVIPNQRMIDKTDGGAESYLAFLAAAVETSRAQGFTPFFLVHETAGDQALAEEVARRTGQPIEIIAEADPLGIKGILGRCQLVISSRFHGLVSALSQGVPVIATGWSHKYQMLLADYTCPECLVGDVNDLAALNTKLIAATAPASRADLLARLESAGKKQKELVASMWREVETLLSVA